MDIDLKKNLISIKSRKNKFNYFVIVYVLLSRHNKHGAIIAFSGIIILYKL